MSAIETVRVLGLCALAHALNDMHALAEDYAVRAVTTTDATTAGMALMILWADMTIEITGTASPLGVELVFAHADDSGTLVGADEVPSVPRWCGRFIAARAALDYDQARALVGSMATVGGMGVCVPAMLAVCAATIKAHGADTVRRTLS